MKRLALIVWGLVLSAGLAMAADAKTAAPAQKAAQTAAKALTMNGEIVSADAVKKTVTFKNEKGEEQTWAVEGKALSSLKSLKTGEKVVVSYRANEKGEPQAATAIKAAPAAKVSTNLKTQTKK